MIDSNALSKSSGFSDPSTSRAIARNRLWRSASVSLGGFVGPLVFLTSRTSAIRALTILQHLGARYPFNVQVERLFRWRVRPEGDDFCRSRDLWIAPSAYRFRDVIDRPRYGAGQERFTAQASHQLVREIHRIQGFLRIIGKYRLLSNRFQGLHWRRYWCNASISSGGCHFTVRRAPAQHDRGEQLKWKAAHESAL